MSLKPEPSDASRRITVLLEEIQGGEDGAWKRLLPLVYDELLGMARQRLGSLRPGDTLRTMDLVHESYLKLVDRTDPGWQNRRHFFAAASYAMRDILIDQARRRRRLKRGGDWQRVQCNEDIVWKDDRDVDLMALDDVLGKLEERDPRKHEIVMLRYFGGLSIDQVAELLEVSPSTIDREWKFSRAWLRRELEGGFA